MKSWTRSYPVDKQTLEAVSLDQCFERFIAWMNGGLDRSALPGNSITTAVLADNAVHNVGYSETTMDTGRPAGTPTPVWQQVPLNGEQYGTGQRGWRQLHSVNPELSAGVLHVEWSTFVWMNHVRDAIKSSGHVAWHRWRLLVNGNVVADSHKVYNSYANVNLVAEVPVASGSATVAVEYTTSPPYMTNPPGSGDGVNEDEFELFQGGGHLLYIGRHR